MQTLTLSQLNLIKAVKKAFDKPVKDVFAPNKSTGGQLLATAATFIPGYGQFVAPAISLVDQLLTQKPEAPTPMMQMNQNPMGLRFGGPLGGPVITPVARETTSHITNILPSKLLPPIDPLAIDLFMTDTMMAKATAVTPMGIAGYIGSSDSNKHLSEDRTREKAEGGYVNSDFKQYSTGSHASGNDLPVDANGNPSAVPSAFVQNSENMYRIDGKPYVMSDTLRNPETGNHFNTDASKLNSKFKQADLIPEDKNALDFGMKRLATLNDSVRLSTESIQKACGGYMNKNDGGPLDPFARFDKEQPYTGVIPFANAQFSNSALIPGGYDPLADLQPIEPGLALDTTNPMNGQIQFIPGVDLMAQTPNRSFTGKTGGTSTTPAANRDLNYNVIAGILKGAALGKAVHDAFTPAEVEQPILANYQKADAQMMAANADYTQARQDAIGASNLAGSMNRSASNNFGQYNTRQMQNFANLGDTIGRITSAENQARSQMNFAQGQYEAQKAGDDANRLTQNRINNQQNQANANFADRKLFSELSQIGTTFNEFQYYKDMVQNQKEVTTAKINEGLMLIGSQYANFGFSPDFINNLKSGKASIDDQIRFISTTQKVKTNGQTN